MVGRLDKQNNVVGKTQVGCLAAIEELEAEGEVLVTRTQKDGQLKMVFWNEIKPTEEEGGMLVEKGEFGRALLYISLFFVWVNIRAG